MTRSHWKLFFVVVCVCAVVSGCGAKSSLAPSTGNTTSAFALDVKASTPSAPAAGAFINLAVGGRTVVSTTDSSGRVSFTPLEAGSYSGTVKWLGYKQKSFTAMLNSTTASSGTGSVSVNLDEPLLDDADVRAINGSASPASISWGDLNFSGKLKLEPFYASLPAGQIDAVVDFIGTEYITVPGSEVHLSPSKFVRNGDDWSLSYTNWDSCICSSWSGTQCVAPTAQCLAKATEVAIYIVYSPGLGRPATNIVPTTKYTLTSPISIMKK